MCNIWRRGMNENGYLHNTIDVFDRFRMDLRQKCTTNIYGYFWRRYIRKRSDTALVLWRYSFSSIPFLQSSRKLTLKFTHFTPWHTNITTHTHTHTRAHAETHTHPRPRKRTHTDTRTHAHTHAHTRTHSHPHIHTHKHTTAPTHTHTSNFSSQGEGFPDKKIINSYLNFSCT